VDPDRTLLAVEAPACGLRVVLVAGDLDDGGAERLGRLLDLQVRAVLAVRGMPGSGHVVVDLANVRSFGEEGLEILAVTRDAAGRAGVGVHLSGLGSRELLLPQRVRRSLAEFSAFDTLDRALGRLTANPPALTAAPAHQVGRASPTRSSTARTGPVTGTRSDTSGARSSASASNSTPALAR
jgi:anti-anti-sigma regulatory factor